MTFAASARHECRPLALLVALAPAMLLACGGDDLTEPPLGEIRVTTSTAGAVPDPDGYTVSLDGAPGVRIEVNGSLALAADPGEHSVELDDVDAPCAPAGEARRVVLVESNVTTEVAFAVVCEPAQGALIVTTRTDGPLPDPDGYLVTVGDAAPQPIGSTASLTVEQLAPGGYTVLLAGIAANCAVEGGNPVAVDIVADAPSTVEFAITCTAGVEQWTALAAGTGADLTTVWADPASGIGFAAGERDVSRGVEGLLLRYDGSAWSVQLRVDDFRPRGLWGSSADDVYAVGFGFLRGGPVMLHWDGNDWTPVDEFEEPGGEELAFESVWGSSASDVFVVGSAFQGPLGRTLIYRHDGSGWERMSIEGEASPVLTDVWGTSPTDVYAVGRDQLGTPVTGVVLRYDGTTWAPVLEVEQLSLNGVWASSPTDVFAAGFQVEGEDEASTVRGVVWHYDGVAWSPMTLPPVGVLYAIWGTSPRDVYAVGDEGLVLRYDGASWTATTETSSILLDVHGGEPGEVFAVGFGGTILRGTP